MKNLVSLRSRTPSLRPVGQDRPMAVIGREAGRILDIEGRTSRRDYAIAVAVFMIAGVGLTLVPDGAGMVTLAWLAGWGVSLATVTMTARRLRDAGLSAWFAAGMLVPVVNLAMAVGLSVVDDAGGRLRLR